MELSVRAFVFDEKDNILLVKHAPGSMWVLPGGHIEPGETMYEALKRELSEELDIDVMIIGSDIQFSDHNIASLPLPVSIHKIRYEHRERGEIEKLEYVFFARVDGDVEQVQEDEIYDWRRASSDDIFAMEGNREIPKFMQEILEQNEDLLELL